MLQSDQLGGFRGARTATDTLQWFYLHQTHTKDRRWLLRQLQKPEGWPAQE